MINDFSQFHFLRPLFLLIILPLSAIFWKLWRQNSALQSWQKICDAHLLLHLKQYQGASTRHSALSLLFCTSLLLCIALAGPSWVRLPVPSYQSSTARVIILDMSENMFEKAVLPDRLTRAKFLLHDLFQRKELSQVGLVVYTDEPFVVSPLTDDLNTIDSLLDSLTKEVMPVDGQRLDSALQEASQLITQAGFMEGQILILTSTAPDASAVKKAASLYKKGIETSIMPIISEQAGAGVFQSIARAGHGQVFALSDNQSLDRWIQSQSSSPFKTLLKRENKDIPVWRDEGRWFLLPALLGLLPVFRRAWLQRVLS